ncbi:hypothetical protein GIB67_028835, partial [Kingdonia uniflora]
TINGRTKRVRACIGSTLVGSHEDGYNWRKYGQKIIQGDKYPRGYYRCTHSSYQDCKAKKQVQRIDDDASIVEISYQGKHTCTQSPYVDIQGLPIFDGKHGQDQDPNPNEILLNFQTGLKVKTLDLNTSYSSIHFPSISPSVKSAKTESYKLSSLIMDNTFVPQLKSPFSDKIGIQLLILSILHGWL